MPSREAVPPSGVLENVGRLAKEAGIDHEIVMATQPTIRSEAPPPGGEPPTPDREPRAPGGAPRNPSRAAAEPAADGAVEPWLQRAIAAARGRYVVVLPAGRTLPDTWLTALWEHRHDADIVVGSPVRFGGSDDPDRLRQRVCRLGRGMLARHLALPLIDETSPCLIGCRTRLRQVVCGAAGEISRDSGSAREPTDVDFVLTIMLRAACEGYTVARAALEGPVDEQVPVGHSGSGAEASVALLPLRHLRRAWIVRNAASAADYEERAFNSSIPPQRWWQRRRFRIVLGFLEDTDGSTLDVGCGSSRIIQSLPEAIALDVAIPKLRFLKRTNKRRVQASTFQLPFPGDCFDRVVHSEVIEHVPFSREVFSELHRVLKPDGVLVIGTPDYGRPWWPIIEFFYGRILPNAYADEHITHYNRRQLMQLLAEHGFDVIDHAYICGAELIVKAVKQRGVITGARASA